MVYNEDCLETMKRIPDGTVDLILQDPPYAVTKNKWDKPIDLAALWPEWERIAKPNCAFIFTSQQPFTTDLIMSRRKLFRYELIWHKPLSSGFLNAKKMPLRNHENIIVFYRNPPVYNPVMGEGFNKKGVRTHKNKTSNYGHFKSQESNGGYKFDDQGKRYPNSVISITNGNRKNSHPTEKPIDLFRYLISTYSNVGDLVFDGYMGSGTTASAAILEKRLYIGSEIDSEYYRSITKRIEHLNNNPVLI